MIRKIVLAVAACAGLARAGFCAPTFELENGIRLSSATVHCVTPVTGGYRMYFSTPSYYAVFSASSADGVDWTIEPGVRISTRAAFLDAGSVTAFGFYSDPALPGGPYHAYYVGLSTNGYAILSATSTDGLAWNKDDSFSLAFAGGAARVRSPKPYFAGSGAVDLFYIRDTGGAESGADYRIYGAQSLDNGRTFAGEALLTNTTGAYQIDVATLTTGLLRMYIAAPDLAGSTVTRVLAADSANGVTFPAAPTLVFSTAAAQNELSGIAVARSTDTFRWRLYLTSRLNSDATTYIYSALTNTPVITAIGPSIAYTDDGPTNFSVLGEVFDPAMAVAAITLGAGGLIVQSVTPVSDTNVTVRAVPTGAPIGLYNVSVTNPDGRSAVLANALTLDYRPGFTKLTDNLFRPLKGGRAKIEATLYLPGNVTARIYTINGGLVKKLYSGGAPAGTLTLFWAGETDGGRTAASGVYLLKITGPKLDNTEKIVLIK